MSRLDQRPKSPCVAKGVRLKHLLRTFVFLWGLIFWISVVHAEPAVIPGEYILKVRAHAAPTVHSKLQGKAFLKAAFSTKGSYHVTGADAELVEALKADPDVEYIEPNYVLSSIPIDAEGEHFQAQSAQYYDQTGAKVKATEAWTASSPHSDSNRPIVAVIDTGVDIDHYVFRNTGAIWVNPGEIPDNGIDDDFNGYIDDVHGWNFVNQRPASADRENHGTHVAGIVLGATQDILANSLQPAKIQVMPLKFLDGNGSGSTAAAINAIYYAVNMGAKVINCSWGGASYSRALHDAITYAYNNSVLVVTAAGNYSSNNDAKAIYPANYPVPSNVSVAASTDSDRLTNFSNYGESTVHLAAPGSYVYSTVPGDWFSSLSGTSMAAPFVAGVAALALREAPQITAFQLRDLVLSTVDYAPQTRGQTSTGGRINAERMVMTAKTLVTSVAYMPQYSPVHQADRSTASTTNDSPAGGGCGTVSSLAAATYRGGRPGGGFGTAAALALLFGLPLFVWWSLRRAATTPASRRRHDRYLMQSDLVIKCGERELVGTLKTISLGGLSFNVDEALEKGGNVQLKVLGPDGREAIEVEGRIVWSERNQAYGVQFEKAEEGVRSVISSWTRGLVKQAG